MLQELSISNFAIIDHLRLGFAPGMNVLTGETGAGKSIIIDAVSALLGGRLSGETVIRAGAERATIEGIFGLTPAGATSLQPLVDELGLDDGDGTLILSRELNRSGRNVCRVNGRAVTVSVLEQFGQRLVDIHGQGEHLSLLRVREHLGFLDRYAGLAEARATLATTFAELRRVRQALQECLRDERELARRMDLLQFQVAEIDAAKLDAEEEEQLLQQRTLLANAERLQELANSGYALLSGGEQHRRSALDLLGTVLHDLAQLEKLDPTVAEQRQAAENALYQLEDVARALRVYRDGIEFSPARLEQVEERLSLLQSLKRKYGETVADVLRFGESARAELEAISHNEERVAELREREQALLGEAGAQAAQLSVARREAAGRLERAVEEQLAELKMERARFVVAIERAEDATGPEIDGRRWALDATGVDRVEFLIAPNLGEPPKPLAKIASGGETSRLMLAMKGVLSQADAVPTLIFDEIDAGISGRVGTLVGRRLWGLTGSHQVLCVTHLPQIASFADCHLNVSKEIAGERTVTHVRRLAAAERAHELAGMLGGDGTSASLLNAEELLAQVEGWKQQERQPQQGA
ncbi:MAG TPA: DNA repair protein RecN [Anaerolineae bacterium]|nr:DNA repair protein RecN [Anaerolineae bacterium]HOQ98123.1 DNA repair protein RecN [Anaerolineae bacterium]HPL28507.1 DNA repair protein RecN [Anaerolineae bacterium]